MVGGIADLNHRKLNDNGAKFLNVIGAHELRAGLGELLEAVLVGKSMGRTGHPLKLPDHEPILPPEDLEILTFQLIKVVLEILVISVN